MQGFLLICCRYLIFVTLSFFLSLFIYSFICLFTYLLIFIYKNKYIYIYIYIYHTHTYIYMILYLYIAISDVIVKLAARSSGDMSPVPPAAFGLKANSPPESHVTFRGVERERWQRFKFKEGQLLEAVLRDDGGQSQGTMLLAVVEPVSSDSAGHWVVGRYVTASDPHLRWWFTDREGKKLEFPLLWGQLEGLQGCEARPVQGDHHQGALQ